jgi:hypothetical protein
MLQEIVQARSDYQQGNIKQGTIADLMTELVEIHQTRLINISP